MSKMNENVYSVSEVNNFIKQVLADKQELFNIQVIGEISNFKRYPSGHCYFTLKDKGAVLKCVMFRSKAINLQFFPQNGDTVTAIGRIAVYERDGVYQLYTDLLLQQGVGDLMLAYEKLKAKLSQEGLFAETNKKVLPVNPKCIGVITSPAGAAVRDIITVARRRNYGVKIFLYPVLVQGDGAASEIAQAIKFFNKHKLAEVLIVGRGGGSIEDLWAFNEEITVRAVANSKIPVISAVGHETDFTLCDFAADKRAATPSQAAEIAVADIARYKDNIFHLQQRACNSLLPKINMYANRLEFLNNSRIMRDPERLLIDKILQADKCLHQLLQTMQDKMSYAEQNLAMSMVKLNNLSPLAVLGRGYSITQNSNDKLVSSIDQISFGDELITTVTDGEIISVVQEVKRR